MKKRLFALLLAVCMLAAVPVCAAEKTSAAPAASAELLALDDGALLVSDTWNKVVWRVEDGAAGVFAGNVPPAGADGEPAGRYHDGAKDTAYFVEPRGIAPFLDGWAVADAGANVVRYVTADGSVQTLAGSGREGRADGVGANASFSRPVGLAADGEGSLYVSDSDSIRVIEPKTGRVSTLVSGLHEPAGLFWHSGALYVAEAGGSRILRVRGSQVETLAGVLEAAEDEGVYYGGYADGPAASARFDHPMGVAVGEDGAVYVADTLNHAVRVIRDGRVYTLARSEEALSWPADPVGLAWADGKLLSSDRFTGEIRSVDTAERSFPDVAAESWYAFWVAEAARRGVVLGTDSGDFLPGAEVTRAAFVTMLARTARSADGTLRIDGSEALADVPADAWYAESARWAVSSGIVKGIDGAFSADGTLSRAEMAVMLHRFASYLGLDVSASEPLDSFADAADAPDWAADALGWAVAEKILEGGDGGLMPLETATRAQASKVLVAFMDAKGL